MKTLKSSLLFLIENISKSQFEKFKNSLNKDELQLFEGLLAQDLQTDSIAALKVFNVKSNSIAYQKTKNSLQKRINGETLFIDSTIHNLPKIYKITLEQNNIEALIKVYEAFNKTELNISIIENNFQTAYIYYLHSSVLAMCRRLVFHYGNVDHKPQKLAYFNKIYFETITAFSIECLSDLYYNAINNQFGKTQSIDKINMKFEIERYINELKIYEYKIRSQKFHTNFYGLQMIYHHIQHNYLAVVELCDKMIAYLKTLPFKSIGPLKQTLRRKATHLIMIGKYEDATNVLNESLSLEIKGSSLWVNCQYLILTIHVLKKDYKIADDYTQSLLDNKLYKSAKSIFKPLIGLINVYLYLFKLMHVIPNNLEDGQSEVKKYMKEHVNYTKDKIGMNIPVVIAQLIEAIVQRRDAEILDRIEALKKYSSRYITKNKSLRSNCFMNMLIEVVKHNYHLVAIERHTRKYYTKLIANPKISSEEAAEIELIPYEDLWAILLDFIKSRKKA